MPPRPLALAVVLAACAPTGEHAGFDPEDGNADDPRAELAWAAGDMHLHPQCDEVPLSSEELVQRMIAADLQVGSNHVNAETYDRLRPAFDGGDDPASQPGRILHSDLEVAYFATGDGTGHVLFHGLKDLAFSDRPFERPRSVTPIVDWGLAQEGVLAGYAHAWAWPATGYPVPGNDECCIPFEFPVQVARGKASFLCEEIMDELGSGPLSRGGFVLWRTLQNMGYRIALTGGSDIGCLGDQVGVPRTLALVATGPDEEGASGLTYARFLDAIRHGRTVLAAGKGTQLDLLVNGARLGDEVALEAPGEVTVEVRSQLAQAASVDLLVNGVPAAQARLEAGAQTATATLQLSRSAWISARTARAQTSAIYVLVAGAPIRASAEDACYMVKYMDHLRGLVLQGAFPLGDEQAATLLGYDEARTEFLRRFQESGGTTCP